MLDHAPTLDTASAARIALDLYGLKATATPLTSERDQNFLLETDKGRAVLKIANALEAPAMIEAQQRALTHLALTLDIVPRVIFTRDGDGMSTVEGASGASHLVWAVTHLAGEPLAGIRRRTPAMLEDFGRRIGELTLGLATFDHPAIHRDFHWDLARGRTVIREHRALITDHALAALIDALVARFDDHTAALLPTLRASALHNDLNDHNILVARDHVTGIVDFGDMVHGYTIGDLAIAAAYVSLGADDPLRAVAALVRGYHTVFPLTDDDVAAVYGLIVLRLCTSVALAAHQRAQTPGNEYLDVSQAAIRRTLPRLARIPFGLAHAVFRHACGLAPVPASQRVRTWLGANTARFASILPVDLRTAPSTVLDLGVGSALVHGDERMNSEPHLTRRIADAMRGEGTFVAVGRYDEARLLYVAPFFAVGPDARDERRTIHMGLDLFADAGTPVHAPMKGTVHDFADNPLPQDYGPVIVLRHVTDDDVEFFTLYGHLSRASLRELTIGQEIAQGESFATLGAPDENVGWSPHLHLQVITDLLGLGTDFPGVAPASQRSVWRSLSPDPNLIVGVPSNRFPAPRDSKREAVARRRAVIGGNVSIAYRDPVRAERGWKQYLFDEVGRRYLDAYNNVPHVGHAHPRVVEAAARQMAVLNTNTRYLNDRLAEYAERLVATLPDPLAVCYFVNSASEANELALRMARTFTGRTDMIVLDAAYHGHTNALIDLSPYKHAGPGGRGAPDWVHTAMLPDDFRGPFRRSDPHRGLHYATPVAEIVHRIHERGRGLAGFIAESCPSVGGQLILPPRYLAEVYRHIRAAGAVRIADEVQTGLGRMGTHFWAFEAQGVVPDIVVMGKPLGNGHPMAAVVTTKDIAKAFDNGMEFFSTFGGNNVSCEVGLAVLDVMRDEDLQAHAQRVGERLCSGLLELQTRHPIIGDVRGSGLFLGVELVRDRETLEPAGTEASFVANRMRELGVLLGTDGPFHNVVKIRPPMPFDEGNADFLVECLDRALGDLPPTLSS